MHCDTVAKKWQHRGFLCYLFISDKQQFHCTTLRIGILSRILRISILQFHIKCMLKSLDSTRFRVWTFLLIGSKYKGLEPMSCNMNNLIYFNYPIQIIEQYCHSPSNLISNSNKKISLKV